MQTIAQRNAEGIVTMTGDDGRTVQAKIPTNRSMLGIIGVNGLVPGGDYRNDGWVYFAGCPIAKWHSTFERIRIWDPKFNDLPALYRLYKKTQAANEEAWVHISRVLERIWDKGPRKNNEVIAHALPSHTFEWHNDTQPWWEYKVHKGFCGEEGLSFSFNWIDEGKPKKLVNHTLGQRLYNLERRWWDTTSKRFCKARTIFRAAMKRSLPKPEVNKVIALQFGDDTFWFYTVNKGPKVVWWEQFEDEYQFEIKRIV